MKLRAVLVVLAVGWLIYRYAPMSPIETALVVEDQTPAPGESRDSDRAITEAFAERRSEVQVESSGVVAQTLADDNDGARHQRFIVELASGHTVLIAHNIDLAARVPLAQGDAVEFQGEYEWNDRGGVVHWTHHDPNGSHRGGWIRHRGRIYR